MRKIVSTGVGIAPVLLSLLVLVVVPQPAAAKSLFETIFGFLGPKPAPQQPAFDPSRRFDDGDRRGNPFGERGAPQGWQPSTGGQYRTVCVRLCDGYFFPINNSSSRRAFYDDAQQCQARCSQSDTRLFYMSSSRPEIENARDIEGRAYAKLKTAFLYRKSLQKGCGCRPEPWSVAERGRHKKYALAEQGLGDGQGDADQVADGGDRAAITAARPMMIGDGEDAGPGGVMQPTPHDAFQIPATRHAVPSPEPVQRYERIYQRAEIERRVQPVRAAPAPKPASGGWGGLPAVKYRHKWPGQVD